MISIENVISVDLPSSWRLLPQRTMFQGALMNIWPDNGRAYLHDESNNSVSQVVVNINESNILHASVSNSKRSLTRDEARELISQVVPNHFVDFIPHDVVSGSLKEAGVKGRFLIGEELAPIQHFEKQL